MIKVIVGSIVKKVGAKLDTKRKQYVFIVGVIMILIVTIASIYLSKSFAMYSFKVGGKLKIYSFGISLLGLFTNAKQLKFFIYFDLILITLIILMIYQKIISGEKFKSKEIVITDAIKIPAPAGQGQYGSKWFMEDRDKPKVFKINTIDFNNEIIKGLIDTGDIDIKDKIERLEKGENILTIEEEIKKVRADKQTKVEKEKNEKEYEAVFGSDNNEFNEEDFSDDIDIEDSEDGIDIEEIQKVQDNEFEVEKYVHREQDENEYLIANAVKEIAEQNKKELREEKPYDPSEDKCKIFKGGGLITGFYHNEELKKEDVYYVDKDTHSVVIGATRSGKSRCLVMQSIGNTALAGESMVITDPKGELYAYTSEFMRKLGYEVICLDFKSASTSSKYNLLQPIINAKKNVSDEFPNGDIETIVKYSEELANMLIKETKGENPMWTENAKTMITGAILTLVLENDDEEVMNLPNVYRFINSGEGKDLNPKFDNLGLYIKALRNLKPESPIINAMLGVINTPTETRGGFSTNASSATRLFTQPSIWQITHKSNVDLAKMGERKQILYIILPDQDTSYYKIVSIIVKQMYNELVKVSDKYGGRLPIRVNFFLDEFGNFAPIPDLATILTVAGGRGMRFNLFIQGFSQITQKYDKETTEIVKSNCETWVYLKANDTGTLDEISKKLGSYTIYSNSESMNLQNGSTGSSSSSQSLQKRSLLLPEEVKSIDRPYLLVMMGNNAPAINIAPDISKLSLNKMYGMGNEKHNNELRMIRDRQREVIKDTDEVKYFELYKEMIDYCNVNIDPSEDPETHEKLEKRRTIQESEYIKTIQDFLIEREKKRRI